MPWDDKSKSGGPWGSNGNGGSGGSGNDNGSPWSRPGGNGGGKETGGADLEEQMRRMQERFRQRRSSGGGGRKGSGRDNIPSFGPFSFLVMGGIGLFAWLLSGFVIVDEGDKAAIFRLGQWRTNFGPGAHLHLPYPIERHEVMPASKQQSTVIGDASDPKLMLTSDESIVAVVYRVVWFYDTTNPEKFILYVDDGKNLVQASAESVMREVVGRSTFDDVITKSRGKIQADVQKQLQAMLNDYDAGVRVVQVQIQEAGGPLQVQAAFSDVNKASQDAETKRNQAERYANDIVPRARGEAAKMQQDAEAYRDQVTSVATGEAARFDSIYEQYRKAPQVTRERMYLETMERVLKKADKLVLDSNSGAVPYLPIERTQRPKTEGQ